MSLFSRAFDGVPADFASPLDAPAALAALVALKRWAPGKPLLTGQVRPDRILLGFATNSGYGRAWTRFEGRLEAAPRGSVLRGRFVKGALARALSVLFLAAGAFIGIGGLADGAGSLLHGVDSSTPLATPSLVLVAWALGAGAFCAVVLWGTAPSSVEMRDMSGHLANALQAEGSAST